MPKGHYDVLKNKSYRLWLLSRFLTNFAKNMQALVVAWQVYDLAKRPLALGFIGLAEAVPFTLVGLWAGHAADRYEKKQQISGAVGSLGLCSLVLLLLSTSEFPSVMPIYAVMAVTGLLSSFEFAASNAYVQTVVPKEDFPKATAWTLSLYQVTVICGPLLAGYILAKTNVIVAYGLCAGLFFLGSLASFQLKKLPPALERTSADGWKSIKEGLSFLRTKQIIVACMILDMVAVFFGDVIAILPVFAAIYSVGPIGLGVLRAAPAVGSFILSFIEANRSFIKVNWRNFIFTVVAFGLSMILFGLAKNFYLAVFFLMLGGAADGVSVIIRQSVYQANTPDHLRGRVASVSSIFIRLSNELGAFESGLAAQLMGAVPSVFFGGCMTLVTAAIMKLRYSRLEKET